jgi:hypothetical protein
MTAALRCICLSSLVVAYAGAVPPRWGTEKGPQVKPGLDGAILHDRPLREAIRVVADVGLTGIEINANGFQPAVHMPAFDDTLLSDTARDDFLGMFEGTGVSIAGLNSNGNPLQACHWRQACRGCPPVDPAGRAPQPAPPFDYVRPTRRRARDGPAQPGRPRLELRCLGRAGLPAEDRRRLLARDRPPGPDHDIKVAPELPRRTLCSTPPAFTS